MSMHANAKKQLNMRDDHRRSVLRNQIIHFIKNGKLVTTKARVKEVQRLVERLVTIARVGNDFAVLRKVRSKIPYSMEAINLLVKEIAPRYQQRPGGYTRVFNLGRRVSDTAEIAQLSWV